MKEWLSGQVTIDFMTPHSRSIDSASRKTHQLGSGSVGIYGKGISEGRTSVGLARERVSLFGADCGKRVPSITSVREVLSNHEYMSALDKTMNLAPTILSSLPAIVRRTRGGSPMQPKQAQTLFLFLVVLCYSTMTPHASTRCQHLTIRTSKHTSI